MINIQAPAQAVVDKAGQEGPAAIVAAGHLSGVLRNGSLSNGCIEMSQVCLQELIKRVILDGLCRHRWALGDIQRRDAKDVVEQL